MPASTRPVLPPLQTPKSASFPSEIIACGSPLPCLSAVIKHEEVLKTPIEPPAAYTEFLKAMTPVLTSPNPMSAMPRSLSTDEISSGGITPSSVPSTSTSFSSSRSNSHKPHCVSIPPPSPYSRPQSANSPNGLRRLRIPSSPIFSPGVAGSARSPLSSAMSARSPFSPADWSLDGSGRRYFFEAPRSGSARPVSVRSVVTRTVTYKRTPNLEPAPKGKKRKLEHIEMPPPHSPSVATPPTAVV